MFNVVIDSSFFTVHQWLEEVADKLDRTESMLRKKRKKTPEEKELFESAKKRWGLIYRIQSDLADQFREYNKQHGALTEAHYFVDISIDLSTLIEYWQAKADVAAQTGTPEGIFEAGTYAYLIAQIRPSLEAVKQHSEAQEPLDSDSDQS